MCLILKQPVFFCFSGSKVDGHDFIDSLVASGCKTFIVSKEVKIEGATVILVENVLKALQDLAKFHRGRFDLPVIGITGSNGKTIVKEWLYEILKDDLHIIRSPKSYNSQIGVALSILNLRKEHRLGIFEAGISKVGEMQNLKEMISPTIGIFTGVGEAHNTGFSSLDEKVKEKFLLFSDCDEVICEDIYSKFSQGKVLTWNSKNYEETQSGCIIKWVNSDKEIDFQTQFPSNLLNSVLSASKFIPEAKIVKRIEKLESLSSRLEMVEGKKGNDVINDAYSFDLDSLKIALHHQAENNDGKLIILICSSLSEDVDKEIFWSLVKQYEVNEIVFIGDKAAYPVQANCVVSDFSSKEVLVESDYFNEISNASILIKGFHSDHLEEITLSFEKVTHKTWMEIDLSSMRNNIHFFRELLGEPTKLLVMVKASAYGGGLDRIGRFFRKGKSRLPWCCIYRRRCSIKRSWGETSYFGNEFRTSIF